VVGGGHAGTEAAWQLLDVERKHYYWRKYRDPGQMSWQSSIGGIGKGHLVKEIDALAELWRRLLISAAFSFAPWMQQSPAVRATRAQADRKLYKQAIRSTLENQPNLALFQQTVADLIWSAIKWLALKPKWAWISWQSRGVDDWHVFRR